MATYLYGQRVNVVDKQGNQTVATIVKQKDNNTYDIMLTVSGLESKASVNEQNGINYRITSSIPAATEPQSGGRRRRLSSRRRRIIKRRNTRRRHRKKTTKRR